jgi:hypothetical protein
MILLTKQLSRTLKMCRSVREKGKDKMKGISERVGSGRLRERRYCRNNNAECGLGKWPLTRCTAPLRSSDIYLLRTPTVTLQFR